MKTRPTTHRGRPTEPMTVVSAVMAAILVALLGSFGGSVATVRAADPTPSASESPTPTPTPTPAPTPTATATPSASESPTPTATPVPQMPDPIVLGATVTFYGRGYGHGVGMSQYGARGRAIAGQDSTTILGHYYQGATLGQVAPGTPIRVLILSRWTATVPVPLIVYGRLTPWTIDGIDATFPVDGRLRLIPTASVLTTGMEMTWRVVIDGPDGTNLYDGPKPVTLAIRAAASTGRLQLWSKPTMYDQYRGIFRIITSASAPTVTVVNEVDLEAYLGGVVPVEMPSTWPPAALEAQAVAARSYAARRLRPGVSFYDVPDGSSSQIYRGVLAEKATTNAVIGATTGEVLMQGPTIANTMFHSTGGGATENNENVYTSSTGAKFAGAVSYLRGSSDRTADGLSYDAGAPYATWATRTYSLDQLSAWFAADPRTNVGPLRALDLRDRGVSGRLISVTLIGFAGTKKVSGEVFRSVFNAHRPSSDPLFRSTLFATAPIP